MLYVLIERGCCEKTRIVYKSRLTQKQCWKPHLPTNPYGTQANTSERPPEIPPSHAASPFSCPEETRAAANITRAQQTPSKAQPEQGPGCLPLTSPANPNLWAGNVCQDKPAEMTQVASPPPSCSTEQQPSLAAGSRISWKNDSKLLSGVGEKPPQNRKHPVPPHPLPFFTPY